MVFWPIQARQPDIRNQAVGVLNFKQVNLVCTIHSYCNQLHSGLPVENGSKVPGIFVHMLVYVFT